MIFLGKLNDIPDGQAIGFAHSGDQFIVARQLDRIFAYRNSCPHLRIPLEWRENQFMDSEGEFLRCATHGALFLMYTGECIAGPCQGEYLCSVACHVTQDGEIWLAISS